MSKDEKLPPHNSAWTWEEDKAFECALADTEECVDRWEKVAEAVPGKTVEELKHHYELLIEDIDNIEAGRVPLPRYVSSTEERADPVKDGGGAKKGGHLGNSDSRNGGGKGTKVDQERRKGVAWTEEEHRLFLLGLEKFGKGDWRSISRNFVVTRTPTQVASHAQKYFIRLTSMNKDRRRSSIHDITSADGGDVATSQGPITGQTNSPTAGASSGKSSKQQPLQSPAGIGVSLYGATTLGQPVGGPAVGTPVNPSASGHMAYGVRAPTVMLPGAPTNMAPMTYPMPNASAHR